MSSSLRLPLAWAAMLLCPALFAVNQLGARYVAPRLDARSLLTILVLGVVPGVGAYGAYSFAPAVLGAARTAIGMYLGPLYTVLMAWPLLGEAPAHYHLAGALLVLPGIFLATSLPRGR